MFLNIILSLPPKNNPRMKKSLKTYILLSVSILMLVAGAFPHHHHNESLCLNEDIETCTPPSHSSDNAKHHPGDADNHMCDTTCITHFSFSTSHHHTDCTPCYSFFTLIYSLSGIISEGTDAPGSSDEIAYYIESLHARHFSAVRNFRASPFQG